MLHLTLCTILACTLGTGSHALCTTPASPTLGPAPASTSFERSQPGAARAKAARQHDSVDALSAKFDRAVDAWREELRAARDPKKKRDLHASHPARSFWPRFEALFKKGNRRAALWMIANVRHTDRSRSEALVLVKTLYVRLFEDPLADVETLEEAAERLLRDRKDVGFEQSVQLLTGAFDRAESAATKSLLALMTARLYGRRDDSLASEESLGWLRRAARDFGNNAYSAQALDLLFEQEHLGIGEQAPDFGGKSIDEQEIRLSSQRGKIVVVDFFGFW